jgi:ATP-dependent RNA helicase DeaD
MSQTFHDLGLIPEITQTVDELGYIKPTAIQAESIPPLLDGRDVMGQAQTGTGKTAAFTLPMLQSIQPDGLQTLILSPTRELAIQTADAVYKYGHKLGIRVLPVYGGQPYDRQIRRLKKGVNVVVGTPGRTLDLINKRALKLGGVRFLILDEADEMLKMGFIEDVEAIINATNEDRQTSLFSATLSPQIRRMAEKYMNDPLLIAIEPQEVTVDNVTQRHFMVSERDKIVALSRLLESEDLQNTLIFARTKVGAAELAEKLIARGFPAEAIHGDLVQQDRERILNRFRNGQLSILTATDVVARGVDIPDVSHVINYDIPQLPIEYVHRIGRTGRAGRGGDAITLITPAQRGRLRMIEQFIKKTIDKGTLPTREDILRRRDDQFIAEFTGNLSDFNEDEMTDAEFAMFDKLLGLGYTPELLAVMAVKLLRANESQRPLENIREANEQRGGRGGRGRRSDRGGRGADRGNKPSRRSRSRDSNGREPGMARLRMSIGKSDGVRPADIVYQVASKADIPGHEIGAIDIRQDETYLDVPEAQASVVLQAMKHAQIRGNEMNLVSA